MTNIKLSCRGATARAKVEGAITAGAVGIPVEISCDEAWQDLERTIVFMTPVSRKRLEGVEDAATVPREVLVPGLHLYIGLEGRDAEGNLVIPTNWADCGEIRCSSAGGGQGDYAPQLAGRYYIPQVDEKGVLRWLPSEAGMEEVAPVRLQSGGVYRGKDLTQAFAEEIGGNVWAWLKHRISQEDFEGIRVGDYIPVTCKNGVTFHAQIAGINTYKNLAHGSNRAVGNHIDFVSRELWPEAHQMNKVGWNNGLGSVKFPWTVSDLYFWLNSLSGTVAGNTVDPPNTGTVAVDYTAGGVLRQLPDDLAAAISEKDAYLPQRHNASAQLSSDSMAGMALAGKLWIPTEMEVFGTAVFGSGTFGISGSTQYPLFQSKEHIVKFIAGSDTTAAWWLASAKEGSKTSFCCVFGYGNATQATADAADRYVPVCFRIE